MGGQRPNPFSSRPLPSRRTFLHWAALGLSSALTGCLSFDPPAPSHPASWRGFRFIHVGDLRLTGHRGDLDGRPLRHVLSRAWNVLEKIDRLRGIDFVLFSGSLIANLRPSDGRVLADFLRAVPRPWFAVPGVRDAGGPRSPLSKKEVETLAGLGDGSAWVRKVQRRAWLVGLDTTVPGRTRGRVSDEQIDFLKAQVDAHPDEAVVVFTHHSPVPPAERRLRPAWEEKDSVENQEQLRFVLEAGENIKLVLTGQRPNLELNTASGLHFLNTPSPCQYPGVIREIRIKGREARIIPHFLFPEPVLARERKSLAASAEAVRFNAARPETYADHLLGTSTDREGVLVLR